MKFEKITRQALALTLVLGFAGTANATTLGLTGTPAGADFSRGDSSTAFGVFDSFPGTSYTNDAADSSSGLTGLTLSQPTTFTNSGQGAGLYNNISTFAAGNDILFAGGNALNFALAGSTSFTIGEVYISVKRANSQAGVVADFIPQLSLDNGVTWIAASTGTNAFGTGDTNGAAAGNYSVSSWNWTNLQSLSSSSMLIKLDSNGVSQRPIDGVAVDVAAVPEPSTYALLGLGLVSLAVMRRLRRDGKTVKI